ncbi:dTDP-4-dehydrorhamnose 3,5-epimerase [Clostridioides difficile CD160]|nr:dTDP-4-dehydrorhamnose 3,5-epimerase [Clostridioides difficile CD160]MDI0266941.1 dTDP-4-dehydrorhamnose 3,5-epimerase [Clostridioides difficile]MDI7818461.1 dTDP-4-dehydrorhamnose 3,5-epimerase [Clostridioides difficile]NJJ33950.1 dTDP-4-dehydrorhamnose 3,5-epimerase [Clostridioides difficile]NJK13946.1 dTDP-4-dehydrorhamnose 3,5-epimerase [Clostridioides difficile]
MGKFKFIKTKIEGLYIVEPNVFCDERGYFMESYNKKDFMEQGLDMCFIQDNESSSRKGVLRGMHFQTRYPQGKLVRVIEGEVFDVAVDLRKDSQTFGEWEGVILSDKNKKQFYIPEGFAHGFLVLSEKAVFTYKCTNYYHPEFESGFLWNDKQVSIDWPLEEIEKILLSEKDKKQKSFKEICIEVY